MEGRSQYGRFVARGLTVLAIVGAGCLHPAASPVRAGAASPPTLRTGGLLYAFATQTQRATILPVAYANAFAGERDLAWQAAEAAVPAARDAGGPGGTAADLMERALLGPTALSPDPAAQARARIAAVLGPTIAQVITNAESSATQTGTMAYDLGLVDPRTGALHLTYQDLSIPARGVPLELSRTFAPLRTAGSAIGAGWAFTYGVHLTFDTVGQPLIQDGDGTLTHFVRWSDPSMYLAADAPVREVLLLHPDHSATRQMPGGARQEFDPQGQLVRLADGAGRGLTLRYAGERLVRVDDDAGRSLRFAYDSGGLIRSVSDPLGNTLRYTHDSRGNLIAVTDAAGRTTTFAYENPAPNTYNPVLLTRITQPRGASITLHYDAASRVADIAGPGPLATTFAYSAALSAGLVRTYISDASGAHEEIDTSMPFSSTPSCEKVSAASAGGICRTTGQVAQSTTVHLVDAGGVASDMVTTQTAVIIRDAAGHATTMFRDAGGRPVGIQSDRTGAVRLAYDDSTSALQAITDAHGHTATLSYDDSGHLIAIRDATGALTHILEPAPNVYRIVSPAGHTVGLETDDAGDVVRLIDALGRVTRLTWDADGRLLELDDPVQGRLAYSYDAAGEMTRRTDATGATTRYTYDADGNLTTVEDAQGHAWRFAYNACDLPVALTDALGQTSHIAYDAANRATTLTDPLGHTTRMQYDLGGRLLTVTDALGGTTRYAYDAAGRLTSVTSPRGGKTTLRYDAAGRPATITDPVGLRTTLRYDVAGQLIAADRPAGVTTTYAYDADGRPLGAEVPDGSGATPSYDADGNLLRVTGASGAITYAYDAAGNVTRVDDPGGHTVRYTYDAAGRRASMRDPTGAVTRYAYDRVGHITQIADPLGQAIFGYDILGRRTSAALPGGLTAQYGYDALGRLSAITYRRGGAAVARFTYAYDAAGNVLREVSDRGTRLFSYDALNRLTAVTGPGTTIERYSYDADGNLLSSPAGDVWHYDAADRLVEASAVSFTYDGAGNLTNSSDGVAYRYDQSGHLRAVTWPHGQETYTYDPIGRRLTRTVNAQTVTYSYDGTDPIASFWPTPPLSSRTLYGPWIDEALATGRGDASYSYVHDRIGSVRQLLDGNGHAVGWSEYSAFGRRARGPGLPDSAPGFTGRQTDPVSGLVDLRNRLYDPDHARFLSPDPLAAPGVSPYVYTADNPTTLTDPLGLDPGSSILEQVLKEFQAWNDARAALAAKTLNDFQAGLDARAALSAEVQALSEEGFVKSLDLVSSGTISNITIGLSALGLAIDIGNMIAHPTTRNEINAVVDLVVFFAGLTQFTLAAGLLGLAWGVGNLVYNDITNTDPTFIAMQDSDQTGPGTGGGSPALTLLRGRAPSSVTIGYPVMAAGTAEVTIYDAAGQPVRVLATSRPVAAPDAAMTWDGRDAGGRAVPAGRYYALCDVSPDLDPASDALTLRTIDVTDTVTVPPVPIAAQLQTPGLSAALVLPPDGAMVRGLVPIDGQAAGSDLDHWVVEYGAGDDPAVWTALSPVSDPRAPVSPPGPLPMERSVSLFGNLATLDTGLSNYHYDFPGAAPGVGLNGRYTIRLRVFGRHGQVAETRTHVLVGRVAPYVADSVIDSPDHGAVLAVPALAIHGVAQLFAVEPVTAAPTPPAGLQALSPVYALHPAGYVFGTPATLRITVPAGSTGGVIYGWAGDAQAWQPLPTQRSLDGHTLSAAIARVSDGPALYAVMRAQDAPPAPVLFAAPGEQRGAPDVLLAGIARAGTDVQLLSSGHPVGQPITAGPDGLFGADIALAAGSNRLQAVARDAQERSSVPSAAITLMYAPVPIVLSALRLRSADFVGDAPATLAPGDEVGVEVQTARGARAPDSLAVHVASGADPAGLQLALRHTGEGTLYRGILEVGSAPVGPIPAIGAAGSGDVIRVSGGGLTASLSYRDQEGPPPPLISSPTHPAVLHADFERPEETWPADPAPLGATIERTAGSAAIGHWALQITAGPTGDITARVPIVPFDLASHPVISFAYAVPISTSVDLAVHANGTWWVFGLSDQPPSGYDSLHTLFGPVADYADVLVRDGRWHRMTLAMYQWLRTVIPSGPITVDRMAFGDWEQGGWMAVAPSHANAAGASFLLDDVTIPAVSRTAAARFTWSASDPSGVAAYSYVLDNHPATVPPARDMGLATQASFSSLASGGWWLHVRARDGAGNWGPAAHYPLVVDTLSPVADAPDPSPGGTGEAVLSVHLSEPGGSGIDPASLRFRAFGRVYGPDSGAVTYDLGSSRATLNLGLLNPPPPNLYSGGPVPVALIGAADVAGNQLARPLAWTYTLDIPNDLPGGAQLLTTDGAEAPSFAPDGTRLAFISGRAGGTHLWTIDAGDVAERQGTARQIVSGPGADADPAWSPTGDAIAFASTRGGGSHLWSVAPDGSHLHALTSGPNVDGHPTWSPDGAQLAFVRDGDLWIARRDGSGARRLFSDGERGVHEPAWSPDGLTIAFRHSRYVDQIWSVRVDGSHPGPLTSLSTGEAQSAPAWLADGQVAYVARHGAVTAIYAVKPDGSDQHPLFGQPPALLFAPTASRDGAAVAFVSNRTGIRNVWVSRQFRVDPFAVNRSSFDPLAGQIATLHYQLSSVTMVTLTVVDGQGRVVRTLVRDQRQRAGGHEARWDGRDDHGRLLPEGAYSLNLEAQAPGLSPLQRGVGLAIDELSRHGTLRVQVRLAGRPAAGVTVIIWQHPAGDAYLAQGVTGRDGSVSFSVSAGTYDLTAQSDAGAAGALPRVPIAGMTETDRTIKIMMPVSRPTATESPVPMVSGTATTMATVTPTRGPAGTGLPAASATATATATPSTSTPSTAHGPGTLAVTVYGAHGRGVRDVVVAVFRDRALANEVTVAFTDASGSTSFTLDAGDYTVDVSIEGHSVYRAQVAVAVGAVAHLRVSLGALAVTVRGRSGQAIRGASVDVWEAGAAGGEIAHATSDSAGTATFNLETGDFTVRASDGDAESAEVSVHVTAGARTDVTLTIAS